MLLLIRPRLPPRWSSVTHFIKCTSAATDLTSWLIMCRIETLLVTASVPPSLVDASKIILLLRLLFLSNIVLCLRPVLPYLSQKDEVTDIPLTPSQRALIGLPPSDQASSASASASAAYITPPRYRRNSGINPSPSAPNSHMGTSTGRRTSGNYTSTPITTPRNAGGYSPATPSHQTPSLHTSRYASGSPFAVSLGGSPSLSRSTSNEVPQFNTSTTTNRTGFGTSTSSLGFGLSRSQSLRERKGGFEEGDGIPGTPSPSGPKRQSGVNYKWLYDKGGKLPRSESTGF